MPTAAAGNPGSDRVRRTTPPAINHEIDHRTTTNIHHYSHASQDGIAQRIAALDREWDIDRMLGVNAVMIALAGLALGLASDRKWLLLPVVVVPVLVQHAIRGWSPPVPLLRRLRIRTRDEIDRERQALIRAPEDMAGLPLMGRS